MIARLPGQILAAGDGGAQPPLIPSVRIDVESPCFWAKTRRLSSRQAGARRSQGRQARGLKSKAKTGAGPYHVPTFGEENAMARGSPQIEHLLRRAGFG